MKRQRVEGNLERQFLTAMVVSKPFLAGLAGSLNGDAALLETRYAKQICEWATTYFDRYREAPGANINAMFSAWVEQTQPDEGDADALKDLLKSCTASPPDFNAPHLLDEFSRYLASKRVARLADTITASLASGRTEDALKEINSFRTVDLGSGVGFDPVRDKAALREAFAEPAEPLVKFPGAAGEFFDAALVRDSLIGVQGPEKRGKTFWCLEFVYRAIRSHRKVAMFQVGDLSKAQVMKRWAVRMAGVPLWKSQCQGVAYPMAIRVIEGAEGKEAEVDTDVRSFPRPIDLASARAAQLRFRRRHHCADDSVMFSVHANTSINVRGIHGILDRWKYERGFIPDVIVIDYADILAPEDSSSGKEPRHQSNDTWKALRRLSQDWHACVITPTQANSAAYTVKTQRMGNFSEDKRKLAHVTGLLGLNQTEQEKKQGVMRLNWIVLRESEFHTDQCLWVAQCLPLGQALVKSTK